MANLFHVWGSISAEFKKLSSVCSLLLNYILVLVYASYSIYLFTLQLEIPSQLSVHLWQQLGCCWAKRQMTWRPLVTVISQDESAPRAVYHRKPLPPAVLAQSPEQEPILHHHHLSELHWGLNFANKAGTNSQYQACQKNYEIKYKRVKRCVYLWGVDTG